MKYKSKKISNRITATAVPFFFVSTPGLLAVKFLWALVKLYSFDVVNGFHAKIHLTQLVQDIAAFDEVRKRQRSILLVPLSRADSQNNKVTAL